MSGKPLPTRGHQVWTCCLGRVLAAHMECSGLMRLSLAAGGEFGGPGGHPGAAPVALQRAAQHRQVPRRLWPAARASGSRRRRSHGACCQLGLLVAARLGFCCMWGEMWFCFLQPCATHGRAAWRVGAATPKPFAKGCGAGQAVQGQGRRRCIPWQGCCRMCRRRASRRQEDLLCVSAYLGHTGRAGVSQGWRVMDRLARRCSMLQCDVQIKVGNCCSAWGNKV